MMSGARALLTSWACWSGGEGRANLPSIQAVSPISRRNHKCNVRNHSLQSYKPCSPRQGKLSDILTGDRAQPPSRNPIAPLSRYTIRRRRPNVDSGPRAFPQTRRLDFSVYMAESVLSRCSSARLLRCCGCTPLFYNRSLARRSLRRRPA